MTDEQTTLEKTGTKLLLVALVVIAIIAAYLAIDVLLLSFLGILFGVFLVKTSELLSRFIPLAYLWNLAIVVTLLISISIGSFVMFGVSVESRIQQASNRIDESSEKLKDWLADHPVAISTIESIPYVGKLLDEHFSLEQSSPSETQGGSSKTEDADPQSNSSNSSNSEPSSSNENTQSQSEQASSDTSKSGTSKSSGLAGRAFTVAAELLKTTFGIVTNFAVIFFIGVFVAVDPALYRNGFARLFAIERRSRVVEVMDKMGDALFKWLIGRFIAMLVTGLGTGIALWLLGVPLAFTVGAITGILTFIPNIGAIASLLLAVLLALSQGPTTVIWVVVAYGVLQLIESNIVTPLVQQHQTSIPPALLIAFQIFMGVLVGFLGVLVSTPLLAATLVLVNEVWRKDTLGDDSDDDNIAGIEE